MKFINGRLINIGWKNNADLFLNYVGISKTESKIESIVSKKESGVFFIYVTYNITISTDNDDLIQMNKNEYNFEIAKDGKSVDGDRQDIKAHLRNGLILSLNKIAGNDTKLATEFLQNANLNADTETILTALIQLDFYIY